MCVLDTKINIHYSLGSVRLFLFFENKLILLFRKVIYNFKLFKCQYAFIIFPKDSISNKCYLWTSFFKNIILLTPNFFSHNLILRMTVEYCLSAEIFFSSTHYQVKCIKKYSGIKMYIEQTKQLVNSDYRNLRNKHFSSRSSGSDWHLSSVSTL